MTVPRALRERGPQLSEPQVGSSRDSLQLRNSSLAQPKAHQDFRQMVKPQTTRQLIVQLPQLLNDLLPPLHAESVEENATWQVTRVSCEGSSSCLRCSMTS